MPFAQHGDREIFDEAMKDRPSIGFGKVTMHGYRAVYIKDQGVRGRVPYSPEDPNQKGLRVNIAIDFVITPIDATKPVISVLGVWDWASDFQDVIKPSMQNLAVKIAAIRSIEADSPNFVLLADGNELWYRYEWVKVVNKKTGQPYRVICFRDVYPDEATCKEAAKKEGAVVEAAMDAALPFPSGPTAADLDMQRDALKAFLEPYWKQANRDQKAFAEMLTKPPFNGLFTLDSDEVTSVMTPF